MADFTAPSFSLGLDLDFDQPSPNQDPHFKQSLEPEVDVISSQSTEDDDADFQPQTLISDIQADGSSSHPILKRLKRGLPTPSSKANKGDPFKLVDDEIEDVSSPDDKDKDNYSAMLSHSASSSSKFPSHRYIPVSTQFASRSKVRESTQASITSAFTCMEKSNGKIMLPKLKTSPLRRFQLLDSDSDDPSSSENVFEDAKKINAPASKKQGRANQNLTVNQDKRAKISQSRLQPEDLCQDFGPQKSINIPTPALDEFCDEYFRSVKDKSGQTKEENIYVISANVHDQKNSITGNAELLNNPHNPPPPAYKYFYHDDPRIQRLVRHRLPNFYPLGMSNTESPQSQAADIDYMCQFSESTPRIPGIGGSSGMGRKNLRQSNCKDTSEISGSWVNPKGSISKSKHAGISQGPVDASLLGGPKNASTRRVRAVGSSSGSWFTGEGGKKVYVTKNGQELTGRTAYCRYRKESGTGFKRSRKKAASKKKSQGDEY